MKKKVRLMIAIGIVLVLLGGYLYYENSSLKLSYYEMVDSDIPEAFNNYKVIQISDFHNEKSKRLTKNLIHKIKQEKPNIIVITGDLIDSRRTAIEVSLDFVKELVGVAPIYYVTGNHESRIHNLKDLKEGLEDLGVNVLDNKVRTIELNHSVINLIGINDPSFAHENKLGDGAIVQGALNSLEYDRKAFNLLLCHRPELFETYVKEKMNLVLTGHAHGGQIRFPLLGGVIAPNQGLFPQYTSGSFEEKGTIMIVSRGIGNSLFPFRVNNRPELVVISLKAG